MGGQPCKLKIIMNGQMVQDVAKSLCYQIQEPGVEIPDDAGYKIVDLLNGAEDAVFKAKRIFLESQGFTGPFPKSLS